MPILVLIVEDRPLHAKLFSEMLRGSGHSSVVTLTGREGVTAAQAINPSLIIVDILLPDRDGRDVIEDLRSGLATEGTPILAISAISDIQMERDCLARGADAFLAKPVGLERFQKTVADLLGRAAV